MQNLKLAQNVFRVAERKGCTPGQLALAWLLHKGDDVVPIPGEDMPSAVGGTLGCCLGAVCTVVLAGQTAGIASFIGL